MAIVIDVKGILKQCYHCAEYLETDKRNRCGKTCGQKLSVLWVQKLHDSFDPT